MADPTVLTGIVGAAAGVAGVVAALVIEHRHKEQSEREKELDDAQSSGIAGVESWRELTAAHKDEIRRLQDEVSRLRTDNEAAMARQSARYEEKLSKQQQRITDLENEVAALRKALRGEPP